MIVQLFFKEWIKFSIVHQVEFENQTAAPAKGAYVAHDGWHGEVHDLQWDYDTVPPTVKVIIRLQKFTPQI
jgi:hypothetical protein